MQYFVINTSCWYSKVAAEERQVVVEMSVESKKGTSDADERRGCTRVKADIT